MCIWYKNRAYEVYAVNKTSNSEFRYLIERSYLLFDWSKVVVGYNGRITSYHNKSAYIIFNKKYPGSCPHFKYFQFMARCKLVYKDPVDFFIDSYLCPICRLAPKKGICDSGRNGKHKGKTCKNPECHTALRKITNLRKGGSTCSLQRSDVKNKVKESFQKKWGVDNAGQSKDIREKWQETNKAKTGYAFQFENPSIQKKAKATVLERYGAASVMCANSSLRGFINERLNSEETIRKRRDTMKENGTTGCKSSVEDDLYILLLEYFPEVERQYGDERYNFKCDFYIPINDLFIEYQGYFCHGPKAFSSKDVECSNLVDKWKHRSSNKYKGGEHKRFYSNAIKTYTGLDVRKRETADREGLNWKEFFCKQDMVDWLETLKDNAYYRRLRVRFKKSALRREYYLIHKAEAGYNKVPKHNKIVLQFQSKLFFKQELKMWKDTDKKEKLVSNRLKYIGKGWGELTAWEILRGFKISGKVKKPYSHFSQAWMRKFVEDYKVKSIYDPCGGWGHRLTACTWEFPYIYNDIRKKAVSNCKDIAKFLGMKNKVFYNSDAAALTPKEKYDAVFTCPPYFDKEIYSKKGAENLEYSEFLLWWGRVVKSACMKKPRLFAFVISDALKDDLIKECKKQGLTLDRTHLLGRSKSHFLKKTSTSAEYLVVFSL